MAMRKIIAAKQICDLLAAKGVVPPNCKRIVIDLEADGLVLVYYTVYGDERLLEVVQDVDFRIEES